MPVYARHIVLLLFLFFLLGNEVHGQNDTLSHPPASPPDGATVHVPNYNMGPVMIAHVFSNYLPGTRIQSIDSTARQLHMHRNLDAVMAEAPGVYIKSYGVGGIATPAFRGTGAGHTQIYWEGVPINSASLGLQDFSLVSTALFEDIDLLYGSGSLCFGAGGLGGAINLKDHYRGNYDTPAYSHMLSQEIGSFASSRTAFVASYGKMHLHGQTKVTFNTARNNFSFRNRAQVGNPLSRQVNAESQQFSLLQKVQMGNFSARAWVYDTDRNLPPTMLTVNQGEAQRDRGIRTQIGWERKFNQDFKLNLTGAWFRESTIYENTLAEIYAPSSSDRLAFQAKFSRFQAYLHQDKIIPQVGIRFHHDRARSDGFPGSRTQTLATAFIGVRRYVSKKTQLHFLLREDLSNLGLSPLMGQFSLSSQITGRLFPGFSISRNYRQPTLNDLYWIPGGNPGLMPEHSLSADGYLNVVSHWSAPIRPGFRLGAFVNRVDNWILWIPGAGAIWSPENVNRVLARGFEAEASLKVEKNGWKMDLKADYAFTRSTVQSTLQANDPTLGKQLIYTPLHNGRALVHLRRKHWNASYIHAFTGRRYTTRDNSAHVTGFALGNVRLGYTFRRKQSKSLVTLEGGLDNVWNVDYQNIAWRPMPGRSFFLRLQWRFNPKIL